MKWSQWVKYCNLRGREDRRSIWDHVILRLLHISMLLCPQCSFGRFIWYLPQPCRGKCLFAILVLMGSAPFAGTHSVRTHHAYIISVISSNLMSPTFISISILVSVDVFSVTMHLNGFKKKWLLFNLLHQNVLHALRLNLRRRDFPLRFLFLNKHI